MGQLRRQLVASELLVGEQGERVQEEQRRRAKHRAGAGQGPGVDPYFWATVIGIVPNTTWHQADDGGVEYYFHHGQFQAETMRFLISTRNDPALLATSVRRTLESVNPNFVVERVVPFDRIAYEALW